MIGRLFVVLALASLWAAAPAHANRALKAAYRLLDEGKAKEALALFRSIADSRPRTLGAHEGMVWSYLKLGDPALAARAADQRLQLSADATWQRKWLDIIALVPARRVEAILGFRRVVQDARGDLDAKLRLGQLLLDDNRPTEALPELEAVVAARQRDAAAREALAWTLVRLKRVDDAMREADARRALPGGEKWRLKWAEIAAQIPQRRKEAAQLLADEAKRLPEDLDLRHRLGQLLLDIGDAAAAKGHLEAVAAARPRDPSIREALVWANQRLGQPDEAAAQIELLLALRPNDPVWRERRLEILAQSPRYRAQALTELRARLESAPGDPALRLRFAQLSLANDQSKDALPHFEAIVAAHPQNAAAREGLAWTFLKLGRCEAAAREADAVLGLRPGDADWRNRRWEILAQCPPRRAEALAGFRLLYLEKPTAIRSRLRLAQLLLQDKQAEEALGHFQAIVLAKPRHAEAREGLAWTYLRLGRLSDALREAEIRAEIDKNPAWRGRWLEMLASSPSHREYAIAGYQKLVAAEPSDAARQLRLAQLLVEAKQPKKAIEHFRAVLKLDPQNFDAREGTTWCLVQEGQLERAAFEADARLALRPTDPVWAEKRLEILARVPTRREEAIDGYRKLVASQPANLELRRRLGELFLEAKKPREALPHFEALVRGKPADREAKTSLAWVCVGIGDRARATKLFDEVITANPQDVRALLGRAQLARWSGSTPQARELLQRALEHDPKDVHLKIELARAELDSGNHTLARDLLSAAAAAAPNLPEVQEAQAQLRRATEIHAGVRPTFTDESTPFRRTSLLIPVAFSPLPDTRLRFDLDITRFSVRDESVDRISFGVEARQQLPRGAHLRGHYRARGLIGTGVTHDARGEVGAKLLDRRLEVRAGVRNRAIVDVPIDYEDVASFREIGSGGSTLDGVRERIQVLEGFAAASVAPLPYLYVYVAGDYGSISDGNRRASVAGGFGLDFLSAFNFAPEHVLRLKYDLYFLAFQRTSTRYFSPNVFLVHVPSLEWRYKPAEWATLGAELGLPLRSEASGGNLVGFFAGLRIAERVLLELRFRNIADTQFRTTAFGLYVAGTF